MEQLDLEVVERDHLRSQANGRGHLERAIETFEQCVVEVVALGPFEPESLAVEPQRTVDVGDTQPDVRGKDGHGCGRRAQNGWSPAIATRSMTRRCGK